MTPALEQLAMGRLEGSAHAGVEAHVASCDECGGGNRFTYRW
tara:strand:- start:228 stop:353 length:126 start_codon:yes stop_codon:yes gene_type:complete